jgi:hypothetical protein
MSAWGRGPNDTDSGPAWFFGAMFFVLGLIAIWQKVAA